MKFAYIAGPYRAEHPYQVDLNIMNAKKVGIEIALLGLFPIIPHVNTAHMDGIQDDAFWLNGTLELLRRTADVLIVLQRGCARSSGVQGEIYEAEKREIPVYLWPLEKNALKTFIRNSK